MTATAAADRRQRWRAWFGAWVALVALSTLSPVASPPHAEPIGSWCIACGQRGVADALLNTLLFVPGGLFASLALGRRWGLWIMLAGTASIEVAQWLIPGRYSSVSDVAFNGLGALLGIGLTIDGGRRVAILAAPVLAAGAWLFPIVAFQPVEPGDALYGQWTPVVGGMELYRGRILDVRVGPHPLPSWRVEDLASVQGLWTGEPLELTLESGPRTDHLAAVFSVADGRGFRLLVLAAKGDDLAVYRRAVASSLRLEQPFVWFADVPWSSASGDTVVVSITAPGVFGCLSGPGAATCVAPPVLAQGWQLLLGSAIPPGGLHVAISSLWTLALGTLIGMGTTSGRRGCVAGAVVTLSGLLLTSATPYVGAGAGWGAVLVLGATLGGWTAAACNHGAKTRPPRVAA